MNFYSLYPGWDYIHIGCSGFAQVGDPDYYKKWRIEREILRREVYDKMIVPDPLKGHVQVITIKCPHELGAYHEFIAAFNEERFDAWESSEDPEEVELFNLGWNYLNALECVDMETEELLDMMQDRLVSIMSWTLTWYAHLRAHPTVDS